MDGLEDNVDCISLEEAMGYYRQYRQQRPLRFPYRKGLVFDYFTLRKESGYVEKREKKHPNLGEEEDVIWNGSYFIQKIRRNKDFKSKRRKNARPRRKGCGSPWRNRYCF